MAEIEDIESWVGADIVDPDDDRIGKLDEILVDPETGHALFAVAKTTVLGRRHVVPLQGASFSRGHVRVPVSKDLAASAPAVSGDTVLGADVAALRRHYDLTDGRSTDPDEVGLETASSMARRRDAFEADQRRADELEQAAQRKDAEATDHLAASNNEVGTANAAAAERDQLQAEADRLRDRQP